MARDTRGPVPNGHSDLHRVNLNPPHWRQARRMLAVQAAALALIGVAGLTGTYLAQPRGTSVRVIGIELPPALCWSLVGLGVLAGAAICARRLAMVFTTLIAPLSLLMVIVSAVAATRHDPGPFGFTVAATVFYAVIFCANLATGVWLVPNHIEGPAWVPGRGKSSGAGLDS